MLKRVQEQGERSVPPEVMGVRELAEYLRLSVHTVYRLAEKGILPGRKVGKRWRFHRDVIVAWLACYRDQEVLHPLSEARASHG